MSAFMLDHAHINALVTAAFQLHPSYVWAGKEFDRATHETKMGRILLAENARSVNARYPDTDGDATAGIDGYEHQLNLKDVGRPAVELIKLCNCYDYQACETDDYKQTPAARIVQGIRAAAINNLPGYDDAPWCLSD